MVGGVHALILGHRKSATPRRRPGELLHLVSTSHTRSMGRGIWKSSSLLETTESRSAVWQPIAQQNPNLSNAEAAFNDKKAPPHHISVLTLLRHVELLILVQIESHGRKALRFEIAAVARHINPWRSLGPRIYAR